MSERSAFDEIKSRVDLVDYLVEYCDTEFVADGPGRVAACCPFHQEDTPSFKVEDSRSGGGYKTWRCYGACATGGTVIDAVMMKEGFETPFEAVEILNELYDLGLEQNTERYERFKQTVAQTKTAIERAQAEMESDSKAAQVARGYLHGRGLDDATITHFALAVDTTKTKAGRLAIPIVDRANHPVTISNRALFDVFPCASCGEPVKAKDVAAARHRARRAHERGEPAIDWEACPHCGAAKTEARISWLTSQHPKYLNETDSDKSRILYNEPSARAALREPETIGYFICEGYGDVWAMHQAGHRAASSYNGSTISEWQAEEAAKLAAANGKPIILVPDFDQTGLGKVSSNIRMIRGVAAEQEIQVVHALGLRPDGELCKDCGEVLQHLGAEALDRALRENLWGADEWMIREVVDRINPKTGKPYHSLVRQIELVTEILSEVKHRIALDHIAPWLADKWGRDEAQVRRFILEQITGADAASAQHIMANVQEARAAAHEYVLDKVVIPTGFDELDLCFYGGGMRPGWLGLVIAQSGAGKTSLALQMMQNMVRAGVSCIFFSLEQPKAQLYLRMVQQTLGVSQREAGEMVENDDPALDELNEIWKHFIIIDNVPTEDGKAMDINALTVKKIIQEVNLTRMEKPVQVCFIDHLGIMQPTPDAPKAIKESDAAAAGWIVREMFEHTVKALGVATLILQQCAKHSKPGTPLGADDGYGGSLQKNFSDVVFTMWRPEQEPGIPEDQKIERDGQLKIALAKNRHGPERIAHLAFDWRTLRILSPLQIGMPITDAEPAPVASVAPTTVVASAAESAHEQVSDTPAAAESDAADVAAPEVDEQAERLAAQQAAIAAPAPTTSVDHPEGPEAQLDTAALLKLINGSNADTSQIES